MVVGGRERGKMRHGTLSLSIWMGVRMVHMLVVCHPLLYVETEIDQDEKAG